MICIAPFAKPTTSADKVSVNMFSYTALTTAND